MSDLVTRVGPALRPDPSRVLLRPFVPGQEQVTLGVSKAAAVIRRVSELDAPTVSRALDEIMPHIDEPQGELHEVFRQHLEMLPADVPGRDALTGERAELAGAYLTQEYAVEAAAILNPSIVAHPDQSGLEPTQLRFVLTVRGIGEGHISSLQFREGVIGPEGISIDEPGRRLTQGRTSGAPMTVAQLRGALESMLSTASLDDILDALPDPFTPADLDDTLHKTALLSPRRMLEETPIERLRRLSESTYQREFEPTSVLSERVVFPATAAERAGIEDVRFVAFVEDDGSVEYRGTYTAYDGSTIAPHLMRSSDLRRFRMDKLIGPAAQDKGMALFPRRIDGQLWSLARWNRENLGCARSTDGLSWEQHSELLRPRRSWDLIQLGTCAPPVETDAGWLVITHGVGPLRQYSLEACLLDLDDPTIVRGELDEPLLTPTPDERIGYVPNVVYTCGALVHDGTLVLPYAASDAMINFATIDLDELLGRMRPPQL